MRRGQEYRKPWGLFFFFLKPRITGKAKHTVTHATECAHTHTHTRARVRAHTQEKKTQHNQKSKRNYKNIKFEILVQLLTWDQIESSCSWRYSWGVRRIFLLFHFFFLEGMMSLDKMISSCVHVWTGKFLSRFRISNHYHNRKWKKSPTCIVEKNKKKKKGKEKCHLRCSRYKCKNQREIQKKCMESNFCGKNLGSTTPPPTEFAADNWQHAVTSRKW